MCRAHVHVFPVQVGVPEYTERKSDRVMEEFYIPHSSAPPPPVGEERIRIAEIDDDIIKLAFKGTILALAVEYSASFSCFGILNGRTGIHILQFHLIQCNMHFFSRACMFIV